MFNADMPKGSNIFMTKSSPNNVPDLWGLAFIDSLDCRLHVHSARPRYWHIIGPVENPNGQ